MHRRHAALPTALSIWLCLCSANALAEDPAGVGERAPDVARVAALDAALRAVGKNVPETRARAELTGLLFAPALERALSVAGRSGLGALVAGRKGELGAALRELAEGWAEDARARKAEAGDTPWGPALRAATSDRAAEDMLAGWLGFAPVGRLPVDGTGILAHGEKQVEVQGAAPVGRAGQARAVPNKLLAAQVVASDTDARVGIRLEDCSLASEMGGSGHGNGVLDAGEWVQLELVVVNGSDEAVPEGEARLRALGGCAYADRELEHHLPEMAPFGGRASLRAWVFLGRCPSTEEHLVVLELEQVEGPGGDPLAQTLRLLPHQHEPVSVRELRLGASREVGGGSSRAELLVAADASTEDALERKLRPSDQASAEALSKLVARSLTFVARPAAPGASDRVGPSDRFEILFDGARFREEHAKLGGGTGAGETPAGAGVATVTHVHRRYLALPLAAAGAGAPPAAVAFADPAAVAFADPAAVAFADPAPAPAEPPPEAPAEPSAEAQSSAEQSSEPSSEELEPPSWRVDLAISTGSLETLEPGGDPPLWSSGTLALKSMDLRVSYGREIAGVFDVSYAPGADSTEEGDITVADLHVGAGAGYVLRPIRYVELQPRALVAFVRRTVGLPGSGSDAVGFKVAPLVGLTLRVLPVPNGGLIADVSAAFGSASPVVDGEPVLGGTFVRLGGGLSLVF